MQSQGYEFQSEFARKHTALGEARGEARGEAKAVLRVLDRRGLTVSPEQRERILASADVATLDRWLDLAVTVSATEDLFA